MEEWEGDNGLFSIDTDLYPQEEKRARAVQNTNQLFEPKEHFGFWFEAEDDPVRFDPNADNNSDTLITHLMHRANAAFARNEFKKCIEEIESLKRRVPNLKRIVIASANLTEACCYIELKMDEKAKQLTREVLISCESPEDYIGCYKVWRKLGSMQNSHAQQFALDLITIHYDPHNFFALYSVATSKDLNLLSKTTKGKQLGLDTIKVRLLLRAMFLSQAAVACNDSFFATRYQKLSQVSSQAVECLKSESALTEEEIDHARGTERSNSCLFDVNKLPNDVLMGLFDSNCEQSIKFFGILCDSFVDHFLFSVSLN